MSKTSEKFGKSLQKARKTRGLTQEELAEKLDISRSYMGHLEQGLKNPSFELLQKLAKHLKVKASDLMPF